MMRFATLFTFSFALVLCAVVNAEWRPSSKAGWLRWYENGKHSHSMNLKTRTVLKRNGKGYVKSDIESLPKDAASELLKAVQHYGVGTKVPAQIKAHNTSHTTIEYMPFLAVFSNGKPSLLIPPNKQFVELPPDAMANSNIRNPFSEEDPSIVVKQVYVIVKTSLGQRTITASKGDGANVELSISDSQFLPPLVRETIKFAGIASKTTGPGSITAIEVAEKSLEQARQKFTAARPKLALETQKECEKKLASVESLVKLVRRHLRSRAQLVEAEAKVAEAARKLAEGRRAKAQLEEQAAAAKKKPWRPGAAHSRHANVVAGKLRPNWVPAPGYVWSGDPSGGNWSVKWSPGRKHPARNRIVAGSKPRTWKPIAGYSFAGKPADGDWSVKWTPGIRHSEQTHVIAANGESKWLPERGYEWADSSAMRVRKISNTRPAAKPGKTTPSRKFDKDVYLVGFDYEYDDYSASSQVGQAFWIHEKDYSQLIDTRRTVTSQYIYGATIAGSIENKTKHTMRVRIRVTGRTKKVSSWALLGSRAMGGKQIDDEFDVKIGPGGGSFSKYYDLQKLKTTGLNSIVNETTPSGTYFEHGPFVTVSVLD